MKKITNTIFLLLSILTPTLLSAAQTDCPVQLALTDTAGSPITTSVDYEVHFYGAASGGTELVTADTGTDTPTGGILRIPVTCSSTLLSNANIFLEFVINGETLSPRVEMASSPFAGTAFAVAGNSITLGTDTVGSYVQSLTAGSGINITGGSGESAALTISATGVTLSAGDVTSSTILDGTIATADLADASVTSAKIVDGTIAAGDLASDSVTNAKLADDSVTAAEIAADAVGSSEIAADAVGAAEIATGAVTTTEISDGTITATDVLADAFDFTSLADSMTLDASTDISATGTNVLSITNTGTGDSFVVNDDNPDTTPFAISQHGDVSIGRLIRYYIQEVDSGADVGLGDTFINLLPSSSRIAITCNDAVGCSITMGEKKILDGSEVQIINVTLGGTRVSLSDIAGIQDIVGGTINMTYQDSITLLYRQGVWIETSRYDN